MRFEFSSPTRIVVGNGALAEVGALAQPLDAHALLVTGRTPERAGRLVKLLEGAGVTVTIFPVAGEPDVAIVEAGVNQARQAGCDSVVSFGGGSAIDAGKAIAAMLTNEGELMDYLEVIGRGKTLTRQSAPFVAIPTTAGTGTEVTRNAVLASPKDRVKVSLRSALMLPRVALVDPELTYDLPKGLTASTGLDALTQLIEPYVCCRANPMTDALCVEGLRRAGRSLRAAYRDGGNRSAREDMSVASLFSGLALANAGLGAVHGFAGPIGGMFPAPHGAVCAALLPHVMEMNLRALRQRQPTSDSLRRYDHVARLITGNGQAQAADGLSWVRELVKELEIPGLRAYGITKEGTPDLVEKAGKASSMKANPIALTNEELSEILGRSL
jgi:alcohol dehydrogenase class IV